MKTYTIFDYVKKYGNDSFVVRPFCEVDAAIFAVLCYMNFEDLVPSLDNPGKDIVLSNLNDDELLDYLLDNTVMTNYDRKFFKLCAESKRFGATRLNYLMSKFDKDLAVQFFAMCYILDNGLVVVSFRGTDSSMVGWKEDLMMSFNDKLPSYLEADGYLQTIGMMLPESYFEVIGHSKGGALATHSASFVSKDIQNRIVNIYDLDGPGFKKALDNMANYNDIKDRIIKIMPTDSMIGILLESSVKAKIIRAKSFFIMQHSPYNWLLRGNHFIEVEHLSLGSVQLGYNMNDFVSSLTDDEKREFIDILFSIADDSKIKTIHDMTNRIDRRLFLAFKSLSRIVQNPEKKEMLVMILKLYLTIYFKNMGSAITNRLQEKNKEKKNKESMPIIEVESIEEKKN